MENKGPDRPPRMPHILAEGEWARLDVFFSTGNFEPYVLEVFVALQASKNIPVPSDTFTQHPNVVMEINEQLAEAGIDLELVVAKEVATGPFSFTFIRTSAG